MNYHACFFSLALLFACCSPSVVVAQENDAPRSTRNPSADYLMAVRAKAEAKATQLLRLEAFKGKPAPPGFMRSREGAILSLPFTAKYNDFKGSVDESRNQARLRKGPFDSCRWTGGCDDRGRAEGSGLAVWYQGRKPVLVVGPIFERGRPKGLEITFDAESWPTLWGEGMQVSFQNLDKQECYRFTKKVDWDLQRTSSKGARDDSVASWTASVEGAKVWTSHPVKNAKCSWSGTIDKNGYAERYGIVVWEVDGEITQVSYGQAGDDGRFQGEAYYLEANGAVFWEDRQAWILEAPIGEKPYQLVYPSQLTWLERKVDETRTGVTTTNRDSSGNTSLTRGETFVAAGIALTALAIGVDLFQDSPKSAVEQNRISVKNHGYQVGAAVKSADYGRVRALSLGRGWEGWVVERINAEFVRVKIENAGPHSMYIPGKTYDMADAELEAY